MLAAYLILIAIFCFVNGLIYISALWFLKCGLSRFPKRAHLLIWPFLLAAANIWTALIIIPNAKASLKSLEEGEVYHTAKRPEHISIRDYSSTSSNVCHDLCLELLLEGHVKYVTIIWDNLQQPPGHKTHHVTYEAYEGNCLAYPSVRSHISQFHAFYGYCVRPVDVANQADIELVLDANLNYFFKPILRGTARRYVNGIAVFDRSGSDTKLMAL